MDVQPGSADNVINQNDPGTVEVAILGDAQFDAQSVNIESLRLASAPPVGWWTDLGYWHPTRVRDVNGDGYEDVVASFAIRDLNMQPGDTEIFLTGETWNGTPFMLWDRIRVFPLIE